MLKDLRCSCTINAWWVWTIQTRKEWIKWLMTLDWYVRNPGRFYVVDFYFWSNSLRSRVENGKTAYIAIYLIVIQQTQKKHQAWIHTVTLHLLLLNVPTVPPNSLLLNSACTFQECLSCFCAISWSGLVAFSVASPIPWNSLPFNVRPTTSIATLKRKLLWFRITLLYHCRTHDG